MLNEQISSNDITFDLSSNKKGQPTTAKRPVNMDIINELELVIDSNNQQDLQQVSYILQAILDYPDSTQAQTHSQAMRLGSRDLQQPKKAKQQARLQTSTDLMEEKNQQQFCPCCGFVKQTENISICTAFNGIKNMGLSTYLFFATFRSLSILLCIMALVYAAFALATNIFASRQAVGGTIDWTTLDYIAISLSAKQTNDTESNRLYYFISCWLGVAMILLWVMAMVGIKYKDAKDCQQYDNDTISCSDYSLVIEGLPVDVQKEELQNQLNDYYQTTIRNNNQLPTVWKQPLTIAKVNVGKPFYLSQNALKDEQLEKVKEELDQIREQVAEWIKERQGNNQFSKSKAQREALYEQYKKLNVRKTEKVLEVSQKMRTLLKNENSHQLTTVFVTFQINNAKTVIDHIHKTGLLGRIRALCNDQFKRFSFKRGDTELSPDIYRAPEPEDIIWENIGHNDCSTYCRKFFTFSVTMILLGTSFAIVFGLTKAQENANDNRMLSIAISVTIAIVNVILGVIIKFLTIYEKDYTATYREASLAVKSILAQMVNSIVIPVITAYEIKKNVYSTSGLVDNVFMLGISMTIVPPIMVFVDPYNLFMKLMRCIKSRPGSKLSQTQKEHNCIHEGIEFELGYHYIYIANVFLFVCFFVSLQPVVVIFALLGYFLMYWIQKYCLFNRYRRPVPGTDFVNSAVYRMIMLGPLTYSLGSLTWSNLSPEGIPQQALLPNLIAVGLSVLLIFIPLHTIIFGACFSDQYQKPKNYKDQRILFPSEYDRLNPSTQEEGIIQFKKYMESKIQELKHCSKQKQFQLANLISHNAQRAQQINHGNSAHSFGSAFNGLFGSAGPQPMMNQQQQPLMQLQGVLPGLIPMGQVQQPVGQSPFSFMMPMAQPQHQMSGFHVSSQNTQHSPPRPVYAPNQQIPNPQAMLPRHPPIRVVNPQPGVNPMSLMPPVQMGHHQQVNMGGNRGNPYANQSIIPRSGNHNQLRKNGK